jgi:uncharacterized protein
MRFIIEGPWRKRLLVCLILLSGLKASGQQPSVENSLFWEVNGNGLAESSFLFGSFHLLGSEYVDSLNNVLLKFDSCKTFAGEIIFDSTQMFKMVAASVMKDSTLDQLLLPEWYHETEEWLKELSSYNSLSIFNNINPVVIQLFLVNFLQQDLYGVSQTPMDLHLQSRAQNSGKKIVGLETFDEQLKALFGSLSYKRQAEILVDYVRQKELAKEDLIRLNILYRQQSLSALESLTLDKYTPEEKKMILADRNLNWMKIVPTLFHEQSTFVAVGAMHLTGEDGLVNQLRKAGYFVTPIAQK